MNPYVILGVSTTATKNDIKRAYRKLILQYHPDKNKSSDSAEMFIKIKLSYEVLRDEWSRFEYDSHQHFELPKNLFETYYELMTKLYETNKISSTTYQDMMSLFDTVENYNQHHNTTIVPYIGFIIFFIYKLIT